MSKKQNRQITLKPGQTIEIGPSVKIEPQEPAQTLREFAETVVSKMAESLEIPLDSIDYESPPNFSLARVIRQASLEAITHEPEPKGLMPPSSIGTTYDPITDTVSDMQVTDKDGYIIVDETYDPPRKVDGSIGKVFPEPRRFMPRDCTQCLTRRKPGESYVRVYSKHGKIRYCRCSLCGNTWAQEGE